MPIVYADTVRDLWHGVGYAVAEDRLFLMDAVRRTGAGTLSALTGCGKVDEDIQQRVVTYSDAEYEAMFLTLSADARDMVQGYVDGANAWQRFIHITWPLLLPVTMVVTLFSVVQTFADFQLVYVMTGGGPANATHLFATYAYQIGVGTGLLSEGAAISLAIFPALFLVVLLQLLYIRRVENR